MQAVAVLPRRQYILLFEGVSWIQVSNQKFITPSSPRDFTTIMPGGMINLFKVSVLVLMLYYFYMGVVLIILYYYFFKSYSRCCVVLVLYFLAILSIYWVLYFFSPLLLIILIKKKKLATQVTFVF